MKVQILMSTNNGEKYLKAQLDSILRQTERNCCLLIRDDGSSDNTPAILEYYSKHFSQISFYLGNNLGVQNSYLDLISHVEQDVDYIAFADQDDIWHPLKLSRAIYCLEKIAVRNDEPLLYCGAQQLVDENLKTINPTVSREVYMPSFGNALVQNICTGCTAVADKNLISLIRQYPIENTKDIVMHDWWLYLVASCFGKVFYDSKSYVEYRQHSKNTHGAILNRKALMQYRFKQLFQPRGEIYKQAECFKKCYSEMLNKEKYLPNAQLLEKMILAKKNFKHKLLLASDKQIYRQKKMDDVIFRGIVLVGKL